MYYISEVHVAPRKQKPAPRVREPIQVYLDVRDVTILNDLARATGLPKTEVLRQGLRRLAADELTERRPGWSLDVLTGALGDAPDLPADFAERHDDYLYGRHRGRGPRVR